MELREVFTNLETDRRDVELFLKAQGLTLEKDVEYTLAALENGKILGTGSLSGNVLKCLAVEPSEQGQGIAASLVSALVHEAFRRGKEHLFIYTLPKNEPLFGALGFSVVERMEPHLVLLENKPNGFVQYLVHLRKFRVERGVSGTVVVNCNPFTLGHRYLLETAASQCDTLHVFVVEEDRSTFPTKVRYRLIEEGTRDLPNLKLHLGGPYIISAATFPSYFLKDPGEASVLHARFDVELFGKRICPILNITRRFVGEEPYCAVTAAYNTAMQEILPQFGVEVRIIPRLTKQGAAISASTVRKLLREGRVEKVRDLVPETTFAFLQSAEAVPILEKLKEKETRH